ncbi:MAG: hypothetical protein IT538_09000 [Variibacter sp.]|nr:hypothetical protein [Variibacter sp.]
MSKYLPKRRPKRPDPKPPKRNERWARQSAAATNERFHERRLWGRFDFIEEFVRDVVGETMDGEIEFVVARLMVEMQVAAAEDVEPPRSLN